LKTEIQKVCHSDASGIQMFTVPTTSVFFWPAVSLSGSHVYPFSPGLVLSDLVIMVIGGGLEGNGAQLIKVF
jgi:hypothetical protein